MIPATEMTPATGGAGAGAGAGTVQLGDTTYTKVFVGGLAWETHKETLRNYFQQFGDILEAVVITDRATARSKGYGFVTFREPEAAMRACVDATPVIDGRRANCNLACLGAQRSKPSSPSIHTGRHGSGISKNGKGMKSNEARYGGGVGAAFVGGPGPGVGMTHIPHYAIQQGIPLTHYYGGYFPYSADYAYPMNYYGVHGGGGATQYQIYGAAGATTGGMMSCFYPYHLQYGDQASTVGGTAVATNTNATSMTESYGLHYPHPFFQYSSATLPQQHYSPPMSFAATSTPMQSVCFALPQA